MSEPGYLQFVGIVIEFIQDVNVSQTHCEKKVLTRFDEKV